MGTTVLKTIKATNKNKQNTIKANTLKAIPKYRMQTEL